MSQQDWGALVDRITMLGILIARTRMAAVNATSLRLYKV